MLSLAALRRGDHNIWSSNAIFLTGFGSSRQTPDSLLTATTLPPSCACSQVPLKDKDKDKEKDKNRYKDTNIMTIALSLFVCDMSIVFTLSTWELHSLCLQNQFCLGRALSFRNWSQWSNLSSPDGLGHNLKLILQESDKSQIFFWSSQTCTRIRRLIDWLSSMVNHAQKPENGPILDLFNLTQNTFCLYCLILT